MSKAPLLFVVLLALIQTDRVNAQNSAIPMDTLIDRIEAQRSTTPVVILFGGSPYRRDEVLRHLATLGDLGAYGALSEDEGYQLILQHKQRVKLVLIGGRYTTEQRVRIKAWCAEHVPTVLFTEPGVDYPYDNEETKKAVKRLLKR